MFAPFYLLYRLRTSVPSHLLTGLSAEDTPVGSSLFSALQP